MASRIIHLVIGEEIKNRIKLKDSNNFLVGQLLPDATELEELMHNKAHFVKTMREKNSNIYDFSTFFNCFKNEIYNDDLYLGYYIHLIQDVLFRKLGYESWGLLEKRNEPNFKQDLYNDYKLLNKYLIKEHKMKNVISVPKDIEDHSINNICKFNLSSLLDELDKDFQEELGNIQLKYLKFNLLDKYILECAEICVKEINSILSSKETTLNSEDFSWKLKNI